MPTFVRSVFFAAMQADGDSLMHRLPQTCMYTNSHTHVVLPSTAKGSNENKWQSSIPAGT